MPRHRRDDSIGIRRPWPWLPETASADVTAEVLDCAKAADVGATWGQLTQFTWLVVGPRNGLDIPRPARVAETIRHRRQCIPVPCRALSVTHHTNVGRSDPEPGFGPTGRVCRGNRLVVGRSEHGSQRTATLVANAEQTDRHPLAWSQLVPFANADTGKI